MLDQGLALRSNLFISGFSADRPAVLDLATGKLPALRLIQCLNTVFISMLCVFVSEHRVHVSLWRTEEALGILELELQTVVSHPMWVLRTKSWVLWKSSKRP